MGGAAGLAFPVAAVEETHDAFDDRNVCVRCRAAKEGANGVRNDATNVRAESGHLLREQRNATGRRRDAVPRSTVQLRIAGCQERISLSR